MLSRDRAQAQYQQAQAARYQKLFKEGIFSKDQTEQIQASADAQAEGLRAEVLCGADHMGELVEHMLVGAMSAEAALTHFRRQAHKAVITGGDRADIQLAALDTSTRCLILTGNLYPSPVVLNRADELTIAARDSEMLVSREAQAALESIGAGSPYARVLQMKLDDLGAEAGQ